MCLGVEGAHREGDPPVQSGRAEVYLAFRPNTFGNLWPGGRPDDSGLCREDNEGVQNDGLRRTGRGRDTDETQCHD